MYISKRVEKSNSTGFQYTSKDESYDVQWWIELRKMGRNEVISAHRMYREFIAKYC